jgi:hypothetical protein
MALRLEEGSGMNLLLAAGASALLLGLPLASVRAQNSAASPAAPASPAAEEGKEKEATIPDFDPKGLWDGRKMVPFRALDDPKMVKAAEADFVENGDYVLGLTVNGESRAYPTRYVWFHHVVNDKVGKEGQEIAFAVTYCSVCNTGVAFDTSLDGKPVKLDFFGLYNGVACYCDRETESVFLQVNETFAKGPLAGKTLKTRPLLDTTWGQWKSLHPDTLVMSPDLEKYGRFYRPKGNPEPRGYSQFPQPFFTMSMTRADKRLPAFDKVLAVSLPAPAAKANEKPGLPLHRAYPVKALEASSGVVSDSLGTLPLAIFFEPATATAVAVSRVLDGKTLTFETRKGADGTTGYYDKETGTRWNLEGMGEDGPQKGKALGRLDSHLSQWYGWVAYFPDTSIYGRDDAPQPVTWEELTAPGTPSKDP